MRVHDGKVVEKLAYVKGCDVLNIGRSR